MPYAVTQFINCSILRNSQIIREDLWVRDGKILNPEPLFFVELSVANVQVDCKGAIICPGFIDVQINGGFGVDFSDNVDKVEEGIKTVATGILAHGVTAFCPTVVTSPAEVYRKVLPRIHKRPGGKKTGAEILGIHVEGPFINPGKRGAHPTQCLRSLDNGIQDMIDVYGTLNDVCMLTMAPEQPKAVDAIPELVKRRITVSLGHSMGTLSDGENAVNAGASFITHLFNAMLPFHHRDPGLVGLLSSDAIPKNRTVYYGIISDGIHTHPAALRIAFRTHPKGLVLVTDAVSPMGLGAGTHHIGQEVIEIKEDGAFIAGTNTLCGSIATMDECVRYFLKATGCSVVEALDCATLHPAKALGVYPKKGTLGFGADADFIMLDKQLHVVATFIAGACVWEQESQSPFKVQNIS